MTVWILLPAYNEAESFVRLLPKIKNTFEFNRQEYNIVVVNDGSIDNTVSVLEKMSKEMPIEIVTHQINRGLGETERDGFEYIGARCEANDIIIRMDCDDTHEPEYAFKLIKKLNEGYDVVSTSRFQPGGGQVGLNAYRRFISYCANIFMRIIFKIPGIKDYSCGYRAYRGNVIRDAIKIFGNGFIQLKGLGFTSTLETIVKLKLMGCKFAEIPFTLRYDQKVSPSKMVSSVTTLGYFVMAFLYTWPFGGWKRFYKYLAKDYSASPENAIAKFNYTSLKRSLFSKIGG